MGLKDIIKRVFGSGKKSDQVFAPRAPRVRLSYLHRVEFWPSSPWPLEQLWIANISGSGMGLMLPPGFQLPADTSNIVGTLKIDSVSHPIRLRVVRVQENSIGAIIENPSQGFLQSLERYFETELSALKLKPVPENYLKESDRGTPHWFQGTSHCELSYTSSGADVLDFAISVFGNHIEGGSGRALKFSEISHAEEKNKASFKSADLLVPVKTPDKNLVPMALRMLDAIEALDGAHRAAIARSLKNSN